MATLRDKVLGILLVAGLMPAAAVGQQVPAPGAPASQIQQLIDGSGMRTQLLARLQSSGLSADQIRQRLAQAGYDPATLDPYLSSEGTAPAPTSRAVEAARALGLLEVPAVPAGLPPAQPALMAPAVLPQPTPEESLEALRVFGLEVFARSTSQFQPVTAGPVPGTYILGPGDELVLVLTGDVENSYSLPVNRDGFIIVPQVGQIWVNGISIDRLRDQLYTYLGRMYSGVRRGPAATTRFEITVGRLRTNQVFVTGEVGLPGSYLISPVASVLNALYLAGGPTANGTFRNIRIVRAGRTAYVVDLYEYLLAGNNMDSIRLQPGDVIFVPTHGPHVALRGQVGREAIYEMRPSETVAQLIRFAGGTRAPAYLGRARIRRILPTGERPGAGLARTALDVALGEALSDSTRAPTLRDDDDVTVYEVHGQLRNTLTIAGAVWQPADFEYRAGMRLWDLVRRAEGLRPRAYRGLAHISRFDAADSSYSLLAVSLDTTAAGEPVENPPLAEFDVVTVYDQAEHFRPFSVTIAGEVYRPLEVPFEDGTTLRDLIVRAGGLTPSADLEVEVARYVTQEERAAGQLAQILRIRVDSTYITQPGVAENYLGSRDSLTLRLPDDVAARFRIRPLDQVLVRRIPFLVLPRAIKVYGQIRSPGRYALRDRSERLVSMIQERARGLTPEAFAEGFRLYRAGRLVNVDLAAALRDPRNTNNLVLEDGDSLFIPEFEAVVTVTGAVNSPSTVLYRPGAGLGYYIGNAGGYAANADAGRTHVRYANGSARVRGKRLIFFKVSPQPGPGSTISVPVREPGDRFDLRGLLSDVVQIVSAVATIIIVANR